MSLAQKQACGGKDEKRDNDGGPPAFGHCRELSLHLLFFLFTSSCGVMMNQVDNRLVLMGFAFIHHAAVQTTPRTRRKIFSFNDVTAQGFSVAFDNNKEEMPSKRGKITTKMRLPAFFWLPVW